MPDHHGFSADPMTSLRLALLANGYRPVPVAGPKMRVGSPGKQPVMKDWPEICATADEAEVRRWATAERGCSNTGLLCGSMAGVDIDVPVPDLAERIKRAAVAILGPTPLRRVGRAPKVLLAYRTTASLSKMATPEFFLPDGTKVQVEVLAAGQQFVAYGVHPDTGQEYEWTGEGGPDVVPLDELPAVAEVDLRDFVSTAERMLRTAGGRTKAEIDAATKAAAGEPEPKPAAKPKATSAPPGADGDSFFRQVNRAALDDLAAWVPVLFPRAKLQGTGAYRIGSADLGRDYEEDLSIHPKGVQDFGPRKGLSPCDVVQEFGSAPDVKAAAFLLCEWLGRDPAGFGWKETRKAKAGGANDNTEEANQGEGVPPPKPDPNRFGRLQVLTVEDAMNAPPREYLLDGLLAPGEFSVWWGAPKCGKSFLLLRIAYGMAQGLAMWGREAKQVRVCYVAAEGGNGIKGRIHALQKKLGPAPHFNFIAQLVDLFDPEADLSDLIAAVNTLKAEFLVLDTLARVMGAGDENQTRDMNTFVRNCQRIQQETGAHVAVVHHGGWDGSHARGSIALVAAADLVVKVSGENGGLKTAMVELAKDDESGYALGFRLAEEELPPDAKGRPRKTYTAEETDAPQVSRKDGLKLHPEAESLLQHIEDALAAGLGRTAQPIAGIPMVPTMSKRALIPFLIQRGWLRVSVESFQQVSGATSATETLPKSEHIRLWKRLDLLQTKGLSGFSKLDVWLAKPAVTP